MIKNFKDISPLKAKVKVIISRPKPKPDNHKDKAKAWQPQPQGQGHKFWLYSQGLTSLIQVGEQVRQVGKQVTISV